MKKQFEELNDICDLSNGLIEITPRPLERALLSTESERKSPMTPTSVKSSCFLQLLDNQLPQLLEI